MYCKLENTEVGVFNSSLLVSSQYGRSLTSSSSYFVTPDEKIYNYQSYAEISSLNTNTGSVLGGTVLSIEGSYFFSDVNLPAVIQIGGI